MNKTLCVYVKRAYR